MKYTSLYFLISAIVLGLTYGQDLIEDEVALIVGGVKYCEDESNCEPGSWRGNLSSTSDMLALVTECSGLTPNTMQLKSAELFGCPEIVDDFSISDFPHDITFTSGVWLPDTKKVLICGGLDCFSMDGFGQATNKCYWWNPYGEKTWIEDTPMLNKRTSHFLGLMKLNGKPTTAYAVGGYPTNSTTEYFDLYNVTWLPHKDLPKEFNSFDNVYGCIVQAKDEDVLYSLKQNTIKMNIDSSMTTTELSAPPYGSKASGMCAIMDRFGETGIMANNGQFLNIKKNEWQKLQAPPIPFSKPVYTMTDFRGTATIFGMPVCDPSTGQCKTGVDIYSYNAGQDAWNVIGKMKEPRIFHEIIKLPRSVCQAFVTTTTTPIAPTTTATTTTAAAKTTTAGASSLAALSIMISSFMAFLLF